MLTWINNLDGTLLFLIQNHFHYPILNEIMIFLTTIGEKGLIWVLISLVLVIRRKTRYIGIVTMGALVLSAIAGEGVLKHLIERPRPFDAYPAVQLLIEKATTSSFPSGHTTASFAAAFVLGHYLKQYAPVFWILAVAIAFSRLYLFMHYPSDVLGGMVLGLICGKVATSLYAYYQSKRSLPENVFEAETEDFK
jgi:undecaprenyl-diphosphatase